MPMKWDADANMKLLMSAISLSEVKIDADALAKAMSTADNPVTKRAIEQQFTKLKAQAKEGGYLTATSSATPSAPSTPKKKAATPRKKKADSADDDDGEHPDASPAKKPRKTPVKKEKKAKVESGSEEVTVDVQTKSTNGGENEEGEEES